MPSSEFFNLFFISTKLQVYGYTKDKLAVKHVAVAELAKVVNPLVPRVGKNNKNFQIRGHRDRLDLY